MSTSSTQSFDPIRFRHHLHRYPELSLHEHKTASEIIDQLLKFGYSPHTNIGGYGIVVDINSGNPGKETLLRADFDALPITEQAQHDHASRHHGCMHACGHDGHTASLLSVAAHLSEHPPQTGRVILLFQPAEEIGMGAQNMLADPRLQHFNPDAVFAYHNLPGYPLGTVVVKDGPFACASTGVSIQLQGKTSHAAKPENGRSPAKAVSEIMNYLTTLPDSIEDAFCLVTLVHVKVGNPGFGTSPGKADVMATIRSDSDQALHTMQQQLQDFVQAQAQQQGLTATIEWVEPFAATLNDSKCTQEVISAAEALDYPVVIPTAPMRWSEDVGEFLQRWQGTLFCLGSGEQHPELHNPDFDFPDPLLDIAAKLFLQLLHTRHNVAL
ncbi:peptidase M20 [Photobacterium jeanii]|uniref:Peptidase M20 n=1 Tax=Photobacterium jeanii TaxID=858640 RepID=A0A178K206_9GAMM|nr:amidohydrolase [Photobacterium jeanii]OAN11136.1 peptidase M20 [Photobacterium jeanii]PST90655.1 amidohydrolase [Photobacterium jeanii]